ncbi:MAG: hypothetical protein V4671_14640 [Armatimonadota bacterium]
MLVSFRFCALLITLFVFGVTPSAAFAVEMPWFTPDAVSLKAAVRDAAVESLPGKYAVVLPEPFAAPVPLREARYNWRFSRAIYVYAPVRKTTGHQKPPPGLRLVTIIHHEPADLRMAQQTGRLIARLLRLHYEHFGRDATFPRDADIADVWLAPDTPPNGSDFGGETRDNQVYFFATGAPRSPIEWTRTIVHEWGHLTMNAARGFREPENDAGGFLGERLYLKWLRADKNLPVKTNDGVVPEGLDLYYERQISPLIARFSKSGPAVKVLSAMDQAAMDLYIGGVLASDTMHGSLVTGHALRSIEGIRPQDFFVALQKERPSSSRSARTKKKTSK